MLWHQVAAANGKLVFEVPERMIEIAGWVIKAIDLVVLIYIIIRGILSQKGLAPTLALIQLLILGYFEFFVLGHSEPQAMFIVDYLSLVLVLLASIIGPLIIFFGIGYMALHEEHLHLKVSRQPIFFAVLFIFLTAMNGIAMSDSLLWMYTFWEVTTLCSFLLIGHDQTEVANHNAFRALDLNMLGGVAFAIAILVIYGGSHSLSIQSLISKPISLAGGGAMLGVALLCFAGLTKSAQFPFQSWLLGAMVAPTPVSAILHSSTMVKAGVFIIVRLATLLSGTMVGNVIAVAGGFTFLAASAIAISQSNGKKVLAYSTIANLGLIICCAGIGSPAAIGAAILLMIYHAVSKGLLFLCIGTIEQGIGSRDIEDMQGLMKRMPYTTFIMVIGMISMLLPPFGVLLTKWLAIETAVDFPLVLLLLIMGSAFTVVFWAKWIGITLTMSYKKDYYIEKLRPSMSITLAVLIIGVLCATGLITPLFNSLIKPYLDTMGLSPAMSLTSQLGDLTVSLPLFGPIGGVLVTPLLILVLLLVILVPLFLIQTRPEVIKPPYFGGELANNDVRGIEFIAPGDKVENIVVHNYYMSGIFGEEKLIVWMSVIAGAIILIMFGVVR